MRQIGRFLPKLGVCALVPSAQTPNFPFQAWSRKENVYYINIIYLIRQLYDMMGIDLINIFVNHVEGNR
jgi:hypothetical protein